MSTVAQNRETEIFHINQVVHHFNKKKTPKRIIRDLVVGRDWGILSVFKRKFACTKHRGDGGGGSKDFFLIYL